MRLPFTLAFAILVCCNPIALDPIAVSVDVGEVGSDGGIDADSSLGEAALVIVRPVDGDTVEDRLIVEGTAFAPAGIGAVFVSVGPNTPVPTETQDGYRTWSVTLPAGPGETTVQAELFNIEGERVAVAGPILVRRPDRDDSGAPTIRITDPEDGASFPRALVLVRGNTADDRGIVAMDVYRDGELLRERSVATSDWYANWSRLVPLIPGRTSEIVFRAYDQGGRFDEATIFLTSRAAQDREPPMLSVDSPAEGAAVDGPAVSLRGSASDLSGVREVKARWAIDEGDVPAWSEFDTAETEDGYATWTFELSPPPGPVMVEVRAIDAGGLSTTEVRRFDADYIAEFGPENGYRLTDRAAEAAAVLHLSLDREGVTELIAPDIQQDLVLLEIDSLPLLTNTLTAVKDACGTEWREDRSDPRHNCTLTELGRTFAGPDGRWESSAEYAMVRILTMTPANTQVAGTSIAGLQEIADGEFFGLTIGGGFSQILSEALGIARTQEFLGTETTAAALRDGIVAPHPNTGPGGELTITLWDAMNDLSPMAERLGPAGDHPGIVDADEPPFAQVLGPDFRMVLGARSNLRWYDGIDLGGGKDYLARLVDENGPTFDDVVEFDFEDPELFELVGLVEEPVVDLRFQVFEHDTFIDSCTGTVGCQGNLPGAPFRDGSVWGISPWFVEWAIAEGARNQYGTRRFSECYIDFLGCHAAVDIGSDGNPAGWAQFDITLDLGDPPEDQYVWELVNEIGQVALHQPSGGSIPEGEADMAFSVRDVPVGLRASEIQDAVRPYLQDQRDELADRIFSDFGRNNGPVDFYFSRTPTGTPALFFASADDERPTGFSYETVGFFSSPTFGAADRASTTDGLGREFVEVRSAERTLWVTDDDGRVFRLRVWLEGDEVVVHAAESL